MREEPGGEGPGSEDSVRGKPSRRVFLLGGAAGLAAAAAGAGYGVQRGVLPGRGWLYRHLGLNGAAGQIPDGAPGPSASGVFVSAARRGTRCGYAISYPPGHQVGSRLPVLIVLHGKGADHRAAFGDGPGLDRFQAAAALGAGQAPGGET
ncbi:MAG: hypothetical protein LBQ06_01770, partial [Frankiaceae bacterium]|nr:hypothetical protein [Frankiaceae bacterium]